MSTKSTVLLEHHLKELKLPTFLREYDKLAGQCAAEGTDCCQSATMGQIGTRENCCYGEATLSFLTVRL